MTLIRLALAIVVASATFVGWEWVAGNRDRRTAKVAAAEATVLALFAALFFGSLGNSGWWLVFPLIGLLASVRERWLSASHRLGGTNSQFRATLLTATRYFVAGGILALLYR